MAGLQVNCEVLLKIEIWRSFWRVVTIQERETRGDDEMPENLPQESGRSLLLIAASRGLGLAMAEEFLKTGWTVVGTVRAGSGRTKLHELAERYDGRLQVETVDVTQQAEVEALRERLAGRVFAMLFVNAGTTTQEEMVTVGKVSTEEFVRVMVTNALSPMRVVETLEGLVAKDGLIGVMSSGQGSVANNTNGMREVYRGSKAALNQLMRSYAARTAESGRALVLMAPGWVRTELGGPNGRLSVEESVPNVVKVLLRQ
jgi:NAD(P)-dependent dehydrogenase (short-subunit alcohol dehydrogenase family)